MQTPGRARAKLEDSSARPAACLKPLWHDERGPGLVGGACSDLDVVYTEARRVQLIPCILGSLEQRLF